MCVCLVFIAFEFIVILFTFFGVVDGVFTSLTLLIDLPKKKTTHTASKHVWTKLNSLFIHVRVCIKMIRSVKGIKITKPK